jgi:hypothetical protein
MLAKAAMNTNLQAKISQKGSIQQLTVISALRTLITMPQPKEMLLIFVISGITQPSKEMVYGTDNE